MREQRRNRRKVNTESSLISPIFLTLAASTLVGLSATVWLHEAARPASAVEHADTTRHADITSADFLKQKDPTEPVEQRSTISVQSSKTDPADRSTSDVSIVANGKKVELHGDGAMKKTIRSKSSHGNTSVDISIRSNTSHDASSDLQLDVESHSESTTGGG